MRLALLAALLLLAPARLAAQEANPLSLSIGDPISLREPLAGGAVLHGVVVDLDPDALTYRVDGDFRQFFRPYAGIDTIDVKRRSPGASARSGAVWGAFIGAAAGLIGGPFYAMSGDIGTGPAIALFGVGGGVGGAALGAVTGALLFPRRWYRHLCCDSSPPPDPRLSP